METKFSISDSGQLNDIWQCDIEDQNGREIAIVYGENKKEAEQIANQFSQSNNLLESLKHICNISESKGVEGCTWGDTEFDSVSASEGYNQCLEYLKEIAAKAIQKLEPSFSL